MIDLKPYLDAVNAARDREQQIAAEINELFSQNTEESREKALQLGSELDAVQKKLQETQALYEKMQMATRPNDIAKNFVPVSETAQAGSQPTIIKRSEFERWDAAKRAQFIRSGGVLED